MNIDLVHVVATGKDGLIGHQNSLPWYNSKDLKHFAKTTQNTVVIMGRKTYESIGKPLPNRTNIIVTTDHSYKVNDESVYVCHTITEALNSAEVLSNLNHQSNVVHIIGGAEIYNQTMDLIDRIELTQINHKEPWSYQNAYYPRIPEHFTEKSRIVEGDITFITYVKDSS